MSARQTPVGYSIHDLLTRVIPGGVLIAPGAIAVILSQQDSLSNLTTPLVLGIGFLAFLAGESVVVLRSGERVPPPFLEEIYKSAEREEALDLFMKAEMWLTTKIPKVNPSPRVDSDSETISDNLDFNFRDAAEAELGVDFEKDSPQDIYQYLGIFLGDGLTETTRRRRSLYTFASNLQAASILSTFLYSFLFMASFPASLLNNGIGDPLIYLFALIFSLIFVLANLLVKQLFIGISEQYVKSLLMEFRMKLRNPE